MDADDIALPQRFAIQVPLIEAGVDLVGSSLLEFGSGSITVIDMVKGEPIASVDTLKNQGFNPNCIVLLPATP